MLPFLYTFVLLAVGCILSVSANREAAARLGEVLVAERPHRRARAIGAGGMVLVAVLCLAFAAETAPEAVLTLSMGVLLLALAPSADDRAAGSEGVLVGWDARRYEDLEEWRLTGQHLRFRLRGVWTAVPLPEELQRDVRGKLEERIPERQSDFRH